MGNRRFTLGVVSGVALLAVGLTACIGPDRAVPGARFQNDFIAITFDADGPVFHWRREEPIFSLYVTLHDPVRNRDTTVWQVTGREFAGPVTYGRVPDGASQRRPSPSTELPPLEPGRSYSVTAASLSVASTLPFSID